MVINLYNNDLPEDLILSGDLAIDTETMGLNPHRDRLCVIQLTNGDGSTHLVQFEANQYAAPNLKKILSNPDSMKIFHFARFDVAVIYHFLGIELSNIYCTKIASRLCRTYTDCHGLKDLCKELLNVTISKQQQSSYWGATELTTKQKEYAASDVVYLHELKEKLDIMLKKENRLELHRKCCDFLLTRSKLDLIGWADFDIFAYK